MSHVCPTMHPRSCGRSPSSAARCSAAFQAQDSGGCVSFGVEAGARRWFIKGPSTEAAVESVASVVDFHARVPTP